MMALVLRGLPAFRARDHPEWLVAINRSGWSPSIVVRKDYASKITKEGFGRGGFG